MERPTPLKRMWIYAIPGLIALIALQVFINFVNPRIQTYLNDRITHILPELAPLSVQIETVGWSLWLLELELRKVLLTPQKELSDKLNPLSAEVLRVRLDGFKLFRGEFAVSSLELENANVVLFVDQLKSSKPSVGFIPTDEIIKLAGSIPIKNITLSGVNLELVSLKEKWNLKAQDIDAFISQRNSGINIQLKFKQGDFTDPVNTVWPLSLEGLITIYEKSIDFSNVLLSVAENMVSAQGELKNPALPLNKTQGELQLKSRVNLKSFENILGQKIKLSGSNEFSGSVTWREGKFSSPGFTASGRENSIDQHFIGDWQIHGKAIDSTLLVEALKITSEAGFIDVENIEANLEQFLASNELQIKGDLKSDFFDLQQFFKNLNLQKIPVEAFLKTKLSCFGFILPEIKIECSGEMTANQFEVMTQNARGKKSSLVSIDDIKATGKVFVSQSQVDISADLKVGNQSLGSTQGSVSYKEGFDFSFKGDTVHFSDFRNLLNLKWEGSGSLVGKTSGNSSSATVSTQAEFKEFFFEDYFFGDLKTDISYEKGTVTLANAKGSVGKSEYSGGLELQPAEKLISGKIAIPSYDITDLLKIFERYYKFKFDVRGFGQGNLEFQGPLDLSQLSYKLSSSTQRLNFGGEIFDRFNVDVRANQGEVRSFDTLFLKKSGRIVGQGTITNQGIADLKFKSQNIFLEESEFISSINSSISGATDFSLNMTGPLRAPLVQLKGDLSSFLIQDEPLPNSKFDITFGKTEMKGSVNLFGGQLVSDFQFPWVENQRFAWKLDANRWKFSSVLGLIGSSSLLKEYQTELTGNFELKSDKGGVFSSTGSGNLSRFLLQRGNLKLENEKPLSFKALDGVLKLQDWTLLGTAGQIEIESEALSFNNFNLSTRGELNLRLFQALLPFLEELNGKVRVEAKTSGSVIKPQILGSASLQDGFIRLKNLPHPFERIQVRAEFSQDKIFLNSIEAVFAQGAVSGQGLLVVQGPRNVPARVQLKVTNARINFPEGVSTKGDANLLLSGNWFPFTLSGTYKVSEGLFSREFDSAPTQVQVLPQFFARKTFEPLQFDMQVGFEDGIQVKNSMLQSTVTGSLLVQGTTSTPTLKGRVSGKSGSVISFRDKNFEATALNAQFGGEAVIDPDIYVSARSRLDVYDITLIAQGPSSNPTLKLSSIPPLPDQDILSLIAFGVTSQSLEDRSAGGQADTTYGTLGAAILGSAVAKPVEKLFGLQLQITNEFDDSGSKSVSYRKFTLSRKLTDRINISASRPVGNQGKVEASVRYSLTPSLSAIGSYESRESTESGSVTESQNSNSILGFDFEFKKEFK